MGKKIKYTDGYKYQLVENYYFKIMIKPEKDIITKRILLDKKGNLTIKEGYAWDGPSGPVRDTKNTLRGSLIHDALYQLMRCDYLSNKLHRKEADMIFKHVCIEDGISKIIAQIFYIGLKLFGKTFTMAKNKKKIKIAP